MPNQIKDGYTSTLSEEFQKRINAPLTGLDADYLSMGIGSMMPEQVDLLSDHMSMDKENYLDTDKYPYVMPYANKVDITKLWAVPEGKDFKPVLEDFKKATEKVEKAFAQQIGPGDEPLKEYVDAMIINPAKRVQRGWPCAKLTNRLNASGWYKEFGAYTNGGVSEEARKGFAWGDVHFPLNRLIVSVDKVIGLHVDYFEKADNGTITVEEEKNFRQAILEEEIRTLHYLNRVATHTDPVEGEQIKKLSGVGNPAGDYNRYSARGIRLTFADTEARIAGLKAGWPIEDLNALSSFKYAMELIYSDAYYSHESTTPKLLATPAFLPGQQEYLVRMQELWSKIESTPVRDPETRMALLKEMRDVIRDGIDKGFVSTKNLGDEGPKFSFELYDIDRKISRQLTPAETEVMTSGNNLNFDRVGIVEQEETDAERKRREEFEAKERLEREEKELADELEALEREEQEEREARRLAESRGYYDALEENARRRRTEPLPYAERERRRLEIDPAGRIWFFDILEEKRLKAIETTPVNTNTRPPSDQNNILRYYMAKKNLNYDQALDLQLASPEDRRQMAEEYYDDLIAHPFMGVPDDEAAKNARYLGELDAAGIKNLLSQPLPEFDPTDPVQVRGYASGPMGRLASFCMDLGQNDKRLRDMENPSSPVRRAYSSAFGSREEYARLHGQAEIPNTLGEIAVFMNSENVTPLQRAVALHFLQTKYAEIAGRPLSELPADKWIDLRATANGLWESLADFPTEGAPTERTIQLFLEGRIPSPFSEEYLRRFDAKINAVRERITSYGDDTAVNNRLRGIDMARVYNLDYISQREGEQPPLGVLNFRELTPGQIEATRQIFEDTLGNYISTTDMQPMLAVIKGESIYDRFTINGVKASKLVKDDYRIGYDLLSPEQREAAIEAELLKALADPAKQVAFKPLIGRPDGTIIEKQPPVTIPHPVPQRVAENPVQPPNADARSEALLSQTAEGAKKLNGILPGMFDNLQPDYLEKKLAGVQDPAQIQHEKSDFVRGYTQAADMLSGMMAQGAQEGEGPVPGLSDYVKLLGDRVRIAHEHPERQESMPYAALMGLVDQIHVPEPGAVDHRQPGPVFRALADHPSGLNSFPLIDAAKNAQKLMDDTAQFALRARDTGHPMTAEDDINTRRTLLAQITQLEEQLDEMERVFRRKNRGRQVRQTLDDENAIDRFMNGNPGINAVRAELDGRRKAMIQGWPAQDLDLIADLYAKREVIDRALKTMPEGTDQYMAYKRAGRVLREICDKLDGSVIESAEKRNEVLNFIDSYGPAVYNDIISRAGAPEAGQTAAFRESVRRAKEAQIPEAAFRSAEDSMAVGDEAFRLIREKEARQEERREARREERQWTAAYRRQQDEERRRRLREEREDNEMGERLYREGLFDEQAVETEEEAEEREWVRAYNTGRARDEIHRERVIRQLDNREFDSNDFDYQSFDEVFASEEEKAVSPFVPNDEYINMLFEDENFFSNLFENQVRPEAGEGLYGNNQIFGFLEWEDIDTRLREFAEHDGRSLGIRTESSPAVTNDMRAYLMARHGMTFEEVYALNTADLKDRRKYGKEYISELEAHPLNVDMPEEQRAESANYYGSMHREAMERFTDMPFPDLDISDENTMRRIGYGPSMQRAAASFAADMLIDPMNLYFSPYPEVRSAYVDALGGPEGYAGYHDQLTFVRAVEKLARVAADPVSEKSPLRNKAYAKYQLELLKEKMRGKKISEIPDGEGNLLYEVAMKLGAGSIPAEGAPTDEQLQAYLDGKAASPFTQAYTSRVDASINDRIAATFKGRVENSVIKAIKEELGHKPTVYDLSYIPVNPDVEPPRPDYLNMPAEEMRETHIAFNRIFGNFMDAMTNGQARMSMMKGEDFCDRFRIDGKKISELDILQNAKNMKEPGEFRIFMESEILRALADPKRKLDFVPLTINEKGEIAEQEPVTIEKPAFPPFEEVDEALEPAAVTSDTSREIMAYAMALVKLPSNLTTVEGLREGNAYDPQCMYVHLEDKSFFYDYATKGDTDEMEIYMGRHHGHVHIDGDVASFKLMRGLKADGTLNETGKKNLKKLKDILNDEYDKLEDLAREYDAKIPMLAEMIRFGCDDVTTVDKGTPWAVLKQNYSYMNLVSQNGTMHLGVPGTKVPYDQIQVMHELTGYPTGGPSFPLPDAMIAVRRQALATAAHKRSGAAGTLNRMQDRLTRRMILSEMDRAESKLRRLDELDRKSHDIRNPEAMQAAHFNRFLDNDVNHSSSYYPRGTKEVHSDMAGRRSLMANGWPVGDLDALSFLYARRAERKDFAENGKYSEERRTQAKRGYKVLDEICNYLDHTEIRNAEDRKKALEYIRSYGKLVFNDNVLVTPNNREEFKMEIDRMIGRPVMEHEFLSDAERQEYRDSYEQYMAQAGSFRLTPTANGPQTDMERAFLSPENISRLAEANSQMEADTQISGDPALAEARHQIQLLLAEVDSFYRKKELLNPERADERKAAFDKILQRSTDAVDALEEAAEKLTDNGKKTKFTAAEEKMRREIDLARHGVDEMRRRYSAQMDYELQRKDDLEKLEREERKNREDPENLTGQYEVDLGTAMLQLSEEDKQWLVRLLTDPLEEDERFDFNTGEVIPARRRELPERIVVAIDDDGSVKPLVMIMAEKQGRRPDNRTPEEKRRDAIRAERAEKRKAVPYEEGAADLFETGDGGWEAQNREAHRIHERLERGKEADRRRELAQQMGDPRYEWSFSHILRDANEKKQTAEKAFNEADKDPAISDARLASLLDTAKETAYVSEHMEKEVVYSYDADYLDWEISHRWPKIYEEKYLPWIKSETRGLKNVSYSTSMSARKRALQSLPEKERYEILSALAEGLEPAQREELRNRLVGMKAPFGVPYAEQVTKPLHERIEELKKEERPVSPIGVPFAPGDERLEPYREALDYADQVLDSVDEDRIMYGTMAANDRENSINRLRNRQVDQVIAGKDENFRIVAALFMSNDINMLDAGIMPSHEPALEEIISRTQEHSPGYIQALGRLMSRMEEMGITPSGRAEEIIKAYAFGNLAKAKHDLEKAIREGDPDGVIAAKQDYEKWRGNMQELVNFAKENFSPDTAPGNVDTRRNPEVPWEFAGEYTATSQVNGAFMLYSALKSNGITVQEFVEDNEAATRKIFEGFDRKNSYKEQFKDKSIGAALGTMMAEDANQESIRIARTASENHLVFRGIEMFTEADRDKTKLAENRATLSLKMNHRNLVTRTRETKRNPFLQNDGEKRRKEVLQLLSVVNEEDLRADYDRMVCESYFDDRGRKLAPVTAGSYIANRGNIDYTRLADRGADIIRDALAVPNTTFDAAEFMEERQKALISLLTAKAADAGKAGYGRLEYEVTHMEETYDTLRAHNPEMEELTEEQRQRFRTMAQQYMAMSKKAHNSLTAEQKNLIASRKRREGNIARRARAELLAHEVRRDRQDAVRRTQEQNRRRQEDIIRQQQEQQRLAEQRSKEKDAAVRAQLAADYRRLQQAPQLEQRRKANDALPLSVRFRIVFDRLQQADRRKNEVRRENLVDPEAYRDFIIARQGADTRVDQLLKKMVRASQKNPEITRITAASVKEILKGVVDDQRAGEIVAKIPGGIGYSGDLEDLTDEERAIVIGAIAGTIDERISEQIIKEDDAYVPLSDIDLTGSPFMAGQDPERQKQIRANYEKHMLSDGPEVQEIRLLRGEIQNDSTRFAKNRRERRALMDDLDYAERMMRRSDPEVRDKLMELIGSREQCNDDLRKPRLEEDKNREENRYMYGLMQEIRIDGFKVHIPRADKTADIRKLKGEKLSFSPEYTAAVVR
ncbi:MAG: hypothetical protein K6C95_00360, partial [Lachnospiraceae bacterium]|nr:hypothetical protein [Lachnospiraceae bacterium]